MTSSQNVIDLSLKDIDWGFPADKKPYDIQLDFAKELYKCIEKKKIGVFESPTGTGKSLSLLCGSLTWLKSHSSSSFDSQVREPDWVKAFKRRQVEQDPPLNNAKRHFGMHAASNEDVTTISELLRIDAEYDQGNFHVKPPIFKIYYCSRTHSQLAQVIDELGKTKHSAWVRATCLSSRKHMCINSEIMKRSNGSLPKLNDLCIDLQASCQFYYKKENQDGYKTFWHDSKILDIEDAVNLGKKHSTCPYYATRDLQVECHLVTLPYQLMLQRSTREALGITDLSNSIIIFDEAHNLVDCVQNLFSVELKLSQIKLAHEQLANYTEKYSSRLSGPSLINLRQLTIVCGKYMKYFESLNEEKKLSLEPNEFVNKLGLDNVNFLQLDSFARQNHIPYKILGDGYGYSDMHGDDEDYKSDVPLLRLLDFCTALAYSSKDGLIIINAENEMEQGLSYILLHCASHFSEIVQQAYSVILAGGTMAPVTSFLFQLFAGQYTERTIHFSCPHIIPKDNLTVMIQTSGPSGAPITMTWQERQLPCHDDTVRDIGMAISNYCRVIPNGLIVFFVSYSTKNLFLETWKRLGVTFNKKALFHEESDSEISENRRFDSIDCMLLSYRQHAKEKDGAILFAVINGKLSEGINFSDEYGRGVIIIGIPYPNIHASRPTMERKKFMEDTYGDLMYVDDIAMRSVNQTIGRVLRHRNDYAAIILMDSRYVSSKLQNRLPSWMGGFVDVCTNFGDSMGKLSSFFRRK